MKRDPMNDLYQVLQVNPRACSAVVEAAYKALMKEHHPDAGHSGRFAIELNEAHDILSNSLERADYDKARILKSSNRVGPYKILDQIAEGGFGRTYRAEHSILNEIVCIKDCSNVSLADTGLLIKECKILWDLRHYALPAMRDLIQMDDGRILLVMSYIPGPTLEKLVKKVGKVDPEHVAWITERMLNAMTYLHRSGVVHGDIKPQNLIVQADKHMAVLVDFGLSAVKPTHDSSSDGYTPYFAPPEEIAGKPLIPESDYYSLGMTMIYALGGGAEYVERKQVPSDVPDEMCNFIKRLIARDVNNRPQYGKEDLTDTFVDIRKTVFGRRRSGMAPIPGI